MKRNCYWVFVIFASIIFGNAVAVAQPSQLSRTLNFRVNYIPIEIQNGFVLDSVVRPNITPFSPFNAFHFKYNSSGQLIWEDDMGVYDSSYMINGRRFIKPLRLISDNSYNEIGLLSLQMVHYDADSVLQDFEPIIYSYDANYMIISVNYVPNNDTVISSSYRYNSSGNLTSYHWRNHSIDYIDSSIMEYDSFGRLKSRLDAEDDSPNGYFYEYDSIGTATCTIVDSRPQGIPPIDTLQVHHFEYDGSGRELLDIWRYWGDTSSFTVVSTYDGSGKILSLSDFPSNPFNFSYNSDNNLDSCAAGNEVGGNFQPTGILLYDHYGNAFLESFIYTYRPYQIFLYYSKLSSMGVAKSKDTPGVFYLSQNYPNPFNPTTVISYQLPFVSNVTLKVYDVLGREVKTLLEGQQTAGSHTVGFSADKLPSGVYFYSITAGSFHQVKKMVLMK